MRFLLLHDVKFSCHMSHCVVSCIQHWFLLVVIYLFAVPAHGWAWGAYWLECCLVFLHHVMRLTGGMINRL